MAYSTSNASLRSQLDALEGVVVDTHLDDQHDQILHRGNYSRDIRDRAVLLHYVYALSQNLVSELLGPSPRSIRRWYKLWKETGATTKAEAPRDKTVGWSEELQAEIKEYVEGFPCFYIEELQNHFQPKYPEEPLSAATISRGLRFNLGLSRKVMERRAKEACKIERAIYFKKLQWFYMYPHQLLFIDETSKDGRSCWRR